MSRWVVVVAWIALAGSLLLVELAAAQGDGASPSPAPNRAEDRACARVAREWADRHGLDDEGIAVLSGCRQDAGGEWFLPTGPDDPRLPGGPVLSAPEEQRTADLLRRIETQLAGLPATMPPWMVERLEELYDPINHAVTGHLDPDAALAGFQDQYAAVLVSYLRDPANRALADHVWWWASRREAAFPQSECTRRALPPPVCGAVVSMLRINLPPFPWDLADPLVLADYLAWSLDNHLVPSR